MIAPQWLRRVGLRSMPTRSLLFDLVFGTALVVYLHLATHGPHPHLDLGLLAQGVIVAGRRIWTLPAAMAALAVAVTSEVTAWPYPLAVPILIYTVATQTRRWPTSTAYAALGAILLIAPSPYADLTQPRQFAHIIPEAVMLTAPPLLAGLYIRQRQQLIALLIGRADDAEQHALLQAGRTRAEERTRLAEELHDVLAHNLGLLVVHSGALTLTTTDPQTRQLAEHMRGIGTATLEELRDIITVLHADVPAPLAPAHTLADVLQLVERATDAGQPVEYQEHGSPRRLPGPIDRTAYLLVEHCVAHAAHYTPAPRMNIDLQWQPTTLDLRIAIDPAGPDQKIPPPDFQRIKERIEVLGGTLSVQSHPDGSLAQAQLPA